MDRGEYASWKVEAQEEEDETSTPMSDNRTVYLVNIFVVHTLRFLNRFSALCDKKLAQVHRRILRLDATLTLLEAKLKSVDGLELIGIPSSFHVSPEFPSSENRADDSGDSQSAAVQPPLETYGSSKEQTPEQQLQTLRDDPKLSRFFRMLRVGVPEQAVKIQMSIEGLNPDLLNQSIDFFQSPC